MPPELTPTAAERPGVAADDGGPGVAVTRGTGDDLARWDERLARSPQGTMFHRRTFLSVLSDHADARLYPLVGRVDGAVVGLFPVFVGSRGPFTTAFSPPPDLGMSQLGPALVLDGDRTDDDRGEDGRTGDDRGDDSRGDDDRPDDGRAKGGRDEDGRGDDGRSDDGRAEDGRAEDGRSEDGRSEDGRGDGAEARNRAFVDACLDWLADEVAPDFLHLRTAVGYHDHRPFAWRGCDVVPRFTYVVPLPDDPDTLLARFSSDARRNVRGGTDCTVTEAGEAAVERVLSAVRQRYAEQGERLPLPADLPVALYRRLPEGAVRPYVCRVDGEFAGGLVVLDSGETVYRWQGGVRTAAAADHPVNDLLDWRVMRDAVDRGRSAYDLAGANTARICRYKAKFGPDLRTFYRVEAGSRSARLASDVYRRLRDLRARLSSVVCGVPTS